MGFNNATKKARVVSTVVKSRQSYHQGYTVDSAGLVGYREDARGEKARDRNHPGQL